MTAANEPPVIACVECGLPVEQKRRGYVLPTCYACLPPPPPLPRLLAYPGGAGVGQIVVIGDRGRA